MPNVSVIIPNYNHASFLRERIESVLAQTYQDFELIILDDYSSDNSRFIIEFYRGHPKISLISYNKCNSGSTFLQWNKGVHLAKGKWVWIAESDDKADPEFLESLVSQAEMHANIGLAYCQSYKLNSIGEVTGSWLDWTNDLDEGSFLKDFHMNGYDYFIRYLIHKNTIPNASGVIFRKDLFSAVGGADAEIKNCADWLLWIKILMKADVAYVSKPLNYFRYHNQSVIAKALVNKDSKQYFEAFDRTMRFKLQKHFGLIRQGSEASVIKKLDNLNNKYILMENASEGVHRIYQNQSGGWVNVLRSIFQLRTIKYLKSAMSHTLRSRF